MTSGFSDVKTLNEYSEEISLPEPLTELGEMLQAVKVFLSRYIVFSSEAQAIVAALWGAHTSRDRQIARHRGRPLHPDCHGATKAGRGH
jgi:hypothetical protein